MSALIGQHTVPGELTTVGCWSGKNVRMVVATKYLFTLADHDLHVSKRLQEKSDRKSHVIDGRSELSENYILTLRYYTISIQVVGFVHACSS